MSNEMERGDDRDAFEREQMQGRDEAQAGRADDQDMPQRPGLVPVRFILDATCVGDLDYNAVARDLFDFLVDVLGNAAIDPCPEIITLDDYQARLR